jgi:hypothetical protein
MRRDWQSGSHRKEMQMTTRLGIEGRLAEVVKTVLNSAQIDGLLTGNTAYLEGPGGIASLFYGADGIAVVKFASGATKKGPWNILDDHYCIDWETGPANNCSAVVKTAGFIDMVHPQTGERRGRVRNIAPGNPENL